MQQLMLRKEQTSCGAGEDTVVRLRTADAPLRQGRPCRGGAGRYRNVDTQVIGCHQRASLIAQGPV